MILSLYIARKFFIPFIFSVFSLFSIFILQFLMRFSEQLIGKGIALSVYDPDVSLSRLLGANRRFIDAHLPHIGDLIRPSIAEAVQGADVIVVGTTNPAVLAELSAVAAPPQRILDVARVPAGMFSVPVEGLCW